ncbi:hypothetical protein QUA70_14850 [Microcoleus sp. LAD1_D5]|uniref:hypothetical protein n=1 Tax=unclassified Microcoleus TaxID=2642155 RepID=UPI002FD0D54A
MIAGIGLTPINRISTKILIWERETWEETGFFRNSASTTEELKPIVTKCNEASSNLGALQLPSPEEPGNEKKP